MDTETSAPSAARGRVSTNPTSTVDDASVPTTLTPGNGARRALDILSGGDLSTSIETLRLPNHSGGDVQLGADSCFSYRHLRSAGDGPIGYTPSFFIPKSQIDAVAQAISHAKENPRARPKLSMPQDVIDGCESTFEAANEKTQREIPSGTMPWHPSRNWLGIFPQATILQAYDIGCVIDHSVNKYPMLSESLRKRIKFIINHMHSYRHRWLCQLVFGPRFALGAGIADHEDVERIWSRTRKLVPITRNQWNSRRIWMIDQYGAFLNAEGQENLGAWIERQDKKLRTKLRAALRTFRACRMTFRSDAPARLRRELDKVLTLQTQIDAVENAILDAKQEITGSGPPPNTVSLLRRLEATHEKLSQEAEDLYASLNISESFPELADLPRAFAHTLLIVHDLKIVIRRRAIASFQEWEELDRAVAGRREPLGTKLYQATRRAIAKRQPALLKLIGKFNDHCEKLERLCPVGCPIPIPAPLPTQLNALRSDSSLHEDVCISPSPGGIPAWSSTTICREEANQLNLDRANLESWLSPPIPTLRSCSPSRAAARSSVPRASLGIGASTATVARDLPLGFHPAEASRTPAQTHGTVPSQASADVPLVSGVRMSEPCVKPRSGNAREPQFWRCWTSEPMRRAATELGSGRAGTSEAAGNTRRLWPSDAGADSDGDRDDSDVDDKGFSDVPAALQDIGEDGEPYPGSIADPEDAADLLGNNDELEETSGLDGDSSFEIRWNAQPQGNLDRNLLQDLRTHIASSYVIRERLSHFVIQGRAE
ncbi:hypothetical protein B0H13DRAFT_1921094 [Mycena leptocephala]|nr:hypothetical protein B0H13DRAFT_1921094 [Mycena leptocephala]